MLGLGADDLLRSLHEHSRCYTGKKQENAAPVTTRHDSAASILYCHSSQSHRLMPPAVKKVTETAVSSRPGTESAPTILRSSAKRSRPCARRKQEARDIHLDLFVTAPARNLVRNEIDAVHLVRVPGQVHADLERLEVPQLQTREREPQIPDGGCQGACLTGWAIEISRRQDRGDGV